MDQETVNLLIGGVIGIAGGLGGALLEHLFSRRRERTQRKWEAADHLHERVSNALRGWPQPDQRVLPADDVLNEARAAHDRLTGVASGATALGDAEIRLRWDRLMMLLNQVQLDALMATERNDPAERTVNVWPIELGREDLLNALMAVRLDEELPESRLPSTDEMWDLAFPSDGPQPLLTDVLVGWIQRRRG